jgi:hypothetical protein
MPLWEQVKGNLMEWYSIAADKTEELAKIGVRRYDKFGISRDIERQFTELGSYVYNAVTGGREDFPVDATLSAIIERIRELEKDLQLKEAEIEEIRATYRQSTGKSEKAGSAVATPLELPGGESASPAAPSPEDDMVSGEGIEQTEGDANSGPDADQRTPSAPDNR